MYSPLTKETKMDKNDKSNPNNNPIAKYLPIL